ncbi:protein FAR1-RELATED SEQUENCE 6-like [Carya illinoinensis]|uniref:protein FAR1-RELATED SEQUENCE 6-like n=1 Tax=Carya illinoinensis TaxID=32201 RepID=UPI001C721F5C|nr:protein FAR1-RELATED SEQUENCE 6-like [Carya illinoinensis]
MGMVSCLLVLYKKNGVIATYHVKDKVCIETFIKDVTHSVYFNEVEYEAKCTCGLFEMNGILCRYVFIVFKFNCIRSLLEKYILDRWRKDVKRRYVVNQSSYDGVVARPEVSRYSIIIKICYNVATNAASCDEHMEDMSEKLHAMNLVNSSNKPPPDCLVAIPTVDMTTAGSSKKVLSPLVVRGKGRLPSLRRAGRMERLYKPNLKRAIQKEKRR